MRVFLKRPKWLAYLLLSLILAQLAYQFLRYHFGPDEWEKFASTDYGYALSYPENWTVEEYSGRYRNHEGIVAIISDFAGLSPANNLLMVFWRHSEEPNVANTADWGKAVILQENGFNVSSLEEIEIGSDKLPALKQSFQYANDYDGFVLYTTSSIAEYIFFFGTRDDDDVTREVFKRIIASIEFLE